MCTRPRFNPQHWKINMCFYILKKKPAIKQFFNKTFQAEEKKPDFVIDLTRDGLSSNSIGKGYIYVFLRKCIWVCVTVPEFTELFCHCKAALYCSFKGTHMTISVPKSWQPLICFLFFDYVISVWLCNNHSSEIGFFQYGSLVGCLYFCIDNVLLSVVK